VELASSTSAAERFSRMMALSSTRKIRRTKTLTSEYADNYQVAANANDGVPQQ
jgi:hypothetical protein